MSGRSAGRIHYVRCALKRGAQEKKTNVTARVLQVVRTSVKLALAISCEVVCSVMPRNASTVPKPPTVITMAIAIALALAVLIGGVGCWLFVVVGPSLRPFVRSLSLHVLF